MVAVSPLAPPSFPELPAIAGVRLATAEAGIRYRGRTDMLLARFDKGTSVAGVFTRSKCPSAPVEWCRARLGGGTARALLVNSGNANAFTGKSGPALLASILTCDPLPLHRFAPGVPNELGRIVSKALVKDAEERYQTAKDMLIDLRNLKRQLEGTAEVSSEREVGKNKKRVLLFAIALTVVTGLSFGLAPLLRLGGKADLEGLREGAGSGGGQKEGIRSSLVVVEIVKVAVETPLSVAA